MRSRTDLNHPWGMNNRLRVDPGLTRLLGPAGLPGPVATMGPSGCRRFVEFFLATIRNPNTRAAYLQATAGFVRWCEERGVVDLRDTQPIHVAAHIEELTVSHAMPTVKLRLAAIRSLFDWLVTGQIVSVNPAASVRGPRYVVTRGATPVLTADETRQLLDSIPLAPIGGLRDRALIAVMVFSFARISAVVGMDVTDFFPEGKRWQFRLHEKGGRQHIVPCHHTAEAYLDQYLDASGILLASTGPIFRSLDRSGRLTDRRMTRNDALRMVRRRVRAAGLPGAICCHTFRATGITTYLQNGGTIENAQAIAAHASPRTTKLYDRRGDAISLDEIERVVI